MNGALKIRYDLKGLERLMRKMPGVFMAAQKDAAIQFMTWANTGTGGSSKKPPIRYGVLRGSTSAFVGGKLVQVYDQNILPGAKETPTPAKSHTASKDQITWVWNTEYAKIMHEHKGNWGKFTSGDPGAGAKWAEDHLDKDRDAFTRFLAARIKKGAGM